MSRVQGIARLRQRATGPMPIRRGKTDLRKVSSALLPTESPRTSEDGDALCRAANALGTSNVKPMALAGRNAECFLNDTHQLNSYGHLNRAFVGYTTEFERDGNCSSDEN